MSGNGRGGGGCGVLVEREKKITAVKRNLIRVSLMRVIISLYRTDMLFNHFFFFSADDKKRAVCVGDFTNRLFAIIFTFTIIICSSFSLVYDFA